MIKENQLCLIVGGGEHRPEDIGQSCITRRIVAPWHYAIEGVEDSLNDTGETVWFVEIGDDGVFKRAEWLLPIDEYKPEKLEAKGISAIGGGAF